MATKTIKFDKETADKVLRGEIKGKVIVGRNREIHRILCTDKKSKSNIVFTLMCNGDELVNSCMDEKIHIELEIPDKPKELQFKPFDKVLIKYDNGTFHPDMFLETVNIQGKHMAILISRGYCKLEHMLPYEGNEHLIGITDKPKEDLV